MRGLVSMVMATLVLATGAADQPHHRLLFALPSTEGPAMETSFSGAIEAKQLNAFGRPGQVPSGGGGGRPISSVVGSDPSAAVAMIENYVREMTSRPSGDRPGYIMINSRNPAVISQLVAALTQRFGSSSVIQDSQTIQNIVSSSSPDGGPTTTSGSDATSMPVFPFTNRLEKTEPKPSPGHKNDVDFIRRQLASLANLSFSSGILINDTLQKTSQSRNAINYTTPVIPLGSYTSNASPSNVQEAGKGEDISDATNPFPEDESNHLENTSSSLDDNDEQREPTPLSATPGPRPPGSSQDDFIPLATELPPSSQGVISPTSAKIADSNFHMDDGALAQPNDEPISPNKMTPEGTPEEQIELTDDLLSENEVRHSGYEDYYEYIDGELVLSPSKFMRRGPIDSADDGGYVDNINDQSAIGDEDEGLLSKGDVMADASGLQKHQIEDSVSGDFGNEQKLAMSPVKPEVIEVLKTMDDGDLQTLGLMEKIDMVPVMEEKLVPAEVPTLDLLPVEVLEHLANMDNEDLQTLNLLNSVRRLYPGQNEGGLGIQEDEGEELSTSDLVNSTDFDDQRERLSQRPNFNAANFRQSDVPSNFFPSRTSPDQEHHQHHHQNHHPPASLPQLSPEQQQIIARLPTGMQDVVSSIVMAVQSPSTTTTQPPPYLPFPYPYPYPPYPYYPYQQLPSPQPPPVNAGPHASHGAHNQGSHSAHGNHVGDGTHGSHEGHDAHGSHANHGAHGSHTNHGAHGSHTNHGAHGSHDNHGTHGSHANHGTHGNHAGHGDHGNGSHESHTEHGSHGSHGGGHETRVTQSSETSGNGGGAPSSTNLPQSSNRGTSPQTPATVRPTTGTLRPAVVTEPLFRGSLRTEDNADASNDVEGLESNVIANRQGVVDPGLSGTSGGIRDNDNSGHGTVGLLCRNQGTSGFCENRISVGGVPNRPDRNQGLLQLRQDPAQMGNGRPAGGGIVNFRPPQQSSMQMGGPVINVVLPEVPVAPVEQEEEIGPLIDAAPEEPAADEAPQMMDREEMNSLLQSLFSSPTLLLLGIIFATSAAYMAIAMEEQAAQQRFQQAQIAAAFGGQQPPFLQGRRRRRQMPEKWQPRKPFIYEKTEA